MIYTDGIRLISDVGLAELKTFAESIGLTGKNYRVNKFMSFYEMRDQRDNGKAKVAGAQFRTTTQLRKIDAERLAKLRVNNAPPKA